MARTSPSSALEATRESRSIVFTRAFAADEPSAWCELVRHVVALANSGGGVIVIGVDARGAPTGWNPASFLALEHSAVVDHVAAYVGERLDDLEIVEATKRGSKLVTLVVHPKLGSPLIFENPGACGFAKGSVYFRHGAKSEPGVARDMARFASADVTRSRRELLRNVRKVATAPTGSEVVVVSPTRGPAETVERFRVVDDPAAPAVARTDFDITHPYRQTELLRTINERFGERVATAYDIQCVRRVYNIDDRPEFTHAPKFGTRQYSDAFVSWLITEYQRDPDFFTMAKAADPLRHRADTE